LKDTYTYGISGSQVAYQYDALNRLTNVLYPTVVGVHDANHPNQQATILDGLGRVLCKIDPAGVKTGFKYDALGRLVAVTNAFSAPDQTVTQYQYDEVSNLTQQTDAESRITRFAYDPLGRRISRTLPESQVESFGYDIVGNCVSHQDFKGKTTTFEF